MISVVMRARNDMPVVADTLAMLRVQDVPNQVLVFDNGSVDGTREAALRHGARVIDVPAGSYVPGRVLNQAMREASGEIVVFLNSDCTPQHDGWLRVLLEAFVDGGVGAVFGRQIPRPDCHPLYARDTEATYGDGTRQARWRHCFSMASSAVRRAAWEQTRFDESLQYSEDVDWTWRLRQAGWQVRYAPGSVVMHSHNYTLKQYFRRQYGEGRAEARIFEWSPWQRSLLRYAVLPWGRQVLVDVRHCLRTGRLDAALYAPVLRLAGVAGRWAGFRDGWKEATTGALRPACVS